MKNLLLVAALVMAVTAALFEVGNAFATEPNPPAGGDVQATGTVVSVDVGKHTIKLKHDPIKALGWPAMTMNFSVDSSVDLAGVQAGDAVVFTLKPQGQDDYIIVNMKKGP